MVIMNKKLELRKQQVLNLEAKFDFPKFLELMRLALCLSRREVCKSLEISQTRLFFLEKGIYARAPTDELLGSLCLFYGLNFFRLKYKSELFLAQNKNKPQRFGVRWKDSKPDRFDSMLIN